MKRLWKGIALLLALSLLMCTACAAASGGALSDTVSKSESTSIQSNAYSLGESADYDGAIYAAEAPAAAPEAAPVPAETAGGAQADYAKKIVYTGYVTVRAESPAAALEKAIAAAEALGGYAASSYTSAEEDGTGYATAEIKVPADALGKLMDQAEGLGELTERRLESEDISMSYYDIEARLNAAKAEEAQLLGILETCRTVEDVLAVRAQLSTVREEIESYQARINLWDHQVSFATLRLTVQQTKKTVVEGEGSLITVWGAGDVFRRIGQGFQNGWRFLLNALSAVGIGLAYAILPLAVLGAVAFGIVKLVQAGKKRRANRKKEKQG